MTQRTAITNMVVVQPTHTETGSSAVLNAWGCQAWASVAAKTAWFSKRALEN